MPAIASLKDLKAAGKEVLGIYAMPSMRYAPCPMLMEGGEKSGGKISANFGLRKEPRSSGKVRVDEISGGKKSDRIQLRPPRILPSLTLQIQHDSENVKARGRGRINAAG